MRLQGATVNFLGDSITFGSGASTPERRFTDVLAREFGLAKANNYGASGSRIAQQTEISKDPRDRDFCMRVAEMDENADAVVVFGGTNDYGHGDAPLGVSSDREPTTFYGGCHFLMSELLRRYVGKPTVILTPLHRLDEDNPKGDGSKAYNGAPLSVYRSILIEVANYYGMPVLDLYVTSGIQPEHEVCRERLCPDGLHPSDEGHAIIARRLGHFLETL